MHAINKITADVQAPRLNLKPATETSIQIASLYKERREYFENGTPPHKRQTLEATPKEEAYEGQFQAQACEGYPLEA